MSTVLQQELLHMLRSDGASFQSVDTALNEIFAIAPQTKTQKARAIMGSLVEGLNDEELDVYLTELQYLLDSWFDEFERQHFDGLTLRELIME